MDTCNYNCMQTMNQSYRQYEMMAPQQLEKMYPKSYNIIQPVVESTCFKLHSGFGPMYTPSQEQLERMIDGVYNEVEPEVYAAVRESPGKDERQFIGGGRRILRDLIGVLLIRRLLGGRPYYNYPAYYNFPGYYNYPGYYNPPFGIY